MADPRVNRRGAPNRRTTSNRRRAPLAGRAGALTWAGASLFGAGVIGFMGIITAEALYPSAYTTAKSAISDLGSTRPPDSIIHEPSAHIFNSVMMAAGVLTLLGAFLLYRESKRKWPSIFLALYGLGALGVGVFPGNYGNIHAGFALLTFAAGALAAILSYQLTSSPFRYFSVVLGAVGLVGLILYAALGDANPMAPLGEGGVERWIGYPVLLWVTAFGGHLMARRA